MTGFIIRFLATLAVATGLMLFMLAHADEPDAKTRRNVACKVSRVDVAEKRRRTWRWQAELGAQPTPTAYAERRVRSCAYRSWQFRLWQKRAADTYRTVVRLRSPRAAIVWVFGAYGEQALGVAWCESRLTTTARNGQYLGLFQMGSYERSLFGHGDTALEQARAAKRYFVKSGRDWSPWACRWAA